VETLYPAASHKPCRAAAQVEELALALAQDGATEAAEAAFGQLLPALLAWCRPSDRLHAALLPHTLDAACALLQQCGRTTGASTGAVVCGLLRAGPRRCRMTLQRQGPLTLAYGCHDSMDFPGFLYLLRSRARARSCPPLGGMEGSAAAELRIIGDQQQRQARAPRDGCQEGPFRTLSAMFALDWRHL